MQRYKLDKKGEFYSERDMYEQFVDDKIYEEDKTDKGKINKIPNSYLVYVLKNAFKEERKGNYIRFALGDKWKYGAIRYKDNVCKGYVRQNCNSDLFAVTEND